MLKKLTAIYDILDKYDYIVEDWGFEQLRLKKVFSQ